jgi:hypothetical protein
MNTWQRMLLLRSDRSELLGMELGPFPFISGFGILFRVSRLTCLEPRDLFPVLGIRTWTGLNLLQACHRPGASRTRFEERTGLTDTRVPRYWKVSDWSPLDLHGHWSNEDLPLRHCSQCAQYGYHCSLFQLPSIERCPWHGCLLRDRCQRCELPYSPHATTGQDLGQCACGLDLFDGTIAGAKMWEFPCNEACDALENYLAWATRERKRRHFLASSDEVIARAGFRELARPPMEWNTTECGTKIDVITYESPSSSDPSHGAFWGWCLLGSHKPLALTLLSASTHQRLVEVSKLRFGQHPSPTVGLAMVEKFIPPLDVTSGVDRGLNLSAVDPRALNACALVTEAISDCIGESHYSDGVRSTIVQQSNTLDRITGRGYLLRVLEDILVKGYEQGLDALCSVHLGQPHQMRAWVAPVIEFVGHRARLEEIRVVWLPASPLRAEPGPALKDKGEVHSKAAQRTRGGRRSAGGDRAKRKSAR